MSEAPYVFVQCDANGCEKSDGLKICGNCKCYAFCSRKCQALFWKAGGHKKVCDPFKYLRENGILSVADIRESDGDPNKLDLSNLQLSKPAQCCSDPNCKCEMKGGDPVALYRELNGERFFTGMVSTVGSSGQIDFSKVRKLHNASDDIIDGEHHMMNMNEIMSEFANYDDASESLKDDLTKVGLLKLGPQTQSCSDKPRSPLSAKDMLLYKKCQMSGLVDFSHKPPGYFDMEYAEEKFDIKYPFPDGLKPEGGRIIIQNGRDSGLPRWANFDVRARDDVRVLVAGILPPGNRFGPAGMPFTEKMWVDVVSITSFGMITGTPRVPVEDAMGYLANKDKANLISFPITCVVGVKHYKKEDGGYW